MDPFLQDDVTETSVRAAASQRPGKTVLLFCDSVEYPPLVFVLVTRAEKHTAIQQGLPALNDGQESWWVTPWLAILRQGNGPANSCHS